MAGKANNAEGRLKNSVNLPIFPDHLFDGGGPNATFPTGICPDGVIDFLSELLFIDGHESFGFIDTNAPNERRMEFIQRQNGDWPRGEKPLPRHRVAERLISRHDHEEDVEGKKPSLDWELK